MFIRKYPDHLTVDIDKKETAAELKQICHEVSQTYLPKIHFLGRYRTKSLKNILSAASKNPHVHTWRFYCCHFYSFNWRGKHVSNFNDMISAVNNSPYLNELVVINSSYFTSGPFKRITNNKLKSLAGCLFFLDDSISPSLTSIDTIRITNDKIYPQLLKNLPTHIKELHFDSSCDFSQADDALSQFILSCPSLRTVMLYDLSRLDGDDEVRNYLFFYSLFEAYCKHPTMTSIHISEKFPLKTNHVVLHAQNDPRLAPLLLQKTLPQIQYAVSSLSIRFFEIRDLVSIVAEYAQEINTPIFKQREEKLALGPTRTVAEMQSLLSRCNLSFTTYDTSATRFRLLHELIQQMLTYQAPVKFTLAFCQQDIIRMLNVLNYTLIDLRKDPRNMHNVEFIKFNNKLAGMLNVIEDKHGKAANGLVMEYLSIVVEEINRNLKGPVKSLNPSLCSL